MDKLKFIGSLDEEQSENAVKVARMAKEAGVDPVLAVAVAYKEGSLRTNAPRGTSGEIGMMQVMPDTGKGLGYDEKKLAIPNQNIKAGIEYLKLALKETENDSRLAAIFYNGGPKAINALKTGQEPDPSVFDYVRALNSYGTFDEAPSTEQRDGDLQLGDAPPPSQPDPTQIDKSSAEAGEKFLYGGAGAAFGTAAAGKGAYDTQKTANLVKRAGLEERARIAAQRSAGVVPPAAPSVPTPATTPPLGSTIMRPTPPAVGGLTPPMGTADAGRMAAGQTGNMVYNYGKSAKLTDIEAAQALDMTKGEGGVHDLSTQRREALNKLKGMGMGNFAENPMYGGIMTEQPSVGRGPRESFTMRAPVAPSPDLPQGQQGGLSQLPPRQAIPTAPPPPPPPSTGMRARAGLDWITGKLADMMKPVASVTSKYVLPPLGGLSAGLDVADIAHEYRKPVDQRDLIKMGLKGTGALGGVLSMFPASAPVGVPLSIGSTAAQAYRENPEWLRKKMEDLANAPLLDEMTGPTP
jgi:hypothetical protein